MHQGRVTKALSFPVLLLLQRTLGLYPFRSPRRGPTVSRQTHQQRSQAMAPEARPRGENA
jgi:hypothetical protein